MMSFLFLFFFNNIFKAMVLVPTFQPLKASLFFNNKESNKCFFLNKKKI